MSRTRLRALVAAIAVAAAGILAVSAGAQMHQGGGQMSGAQTAGHQHGAMQGAMLGSMAPKQMMTNINTMMAGVTATMRDVTAMHAGAFGSQHDQMTASLRGITDQMHQLHAVMDGLAKNPTLTNNHNAMKSFQQAGAEFQRMGTAFQNVMKGLNQAEKGMSNGGR